MIFILDLIRVNRSINLPEMTLPLIFLYTAIGMNRGRQYDNRLTAKWISQWEYVDSLDNTNRICKIQLSRIINIPFGNYLSNIIFFEAMYLLAIRV